MTHNTYLYGTILGIMLKTMCNLPVPKWSHSILSWCSIELTCQLRKTLFSAGATGTGCKQNKILRKQKSKTKHPSSSGCNHSKEFPIRCLFTGYRKVSIIVDVFCAKTCLNFHHLSYGCDATRSVGRVISV